MTRQPTPGGDNGTWGTVLNDYLSVAHNSDGSLLSAAITATNPTLAGNPLWFPTYVKAASYYFTASPAAVGTSNTLGNNNWRGVAWAVTRSLSITRIGCEFTAAGEANSIFRLGIYGDDGTGVPTGAAVLDAGSISTGSGNAGTIATGGTPGSYEITVSAALTPGVYWIGGAVQGAATTQPTMRTVAGGSLLASLPSSTIPGIGLITTGYVMTSVTGALPTWSGTTISGTTPVRTFIKTA